MRFFYLVAAHNEEAQIAVTCQRLVDALAPFPGSKIYLLENGSRDQTWEKCLEAQARQPGQVAALRSERAGIGLAFKAGIAALVPLHLGLQDWVVLAAADLPFGFSDLRALVNYPKSSKDVLFIGSKSHRLSVVATRTWKRRVASWAFYLIRRALLGMKVKDPQGSIFIRGDHLAELGLFRADNYFYSIEIVDRAERTAAVVEIPVDLDPEVRPSNVHVLRDGLRLFMQLLQYRR